MEGRRDQESICQGQTGSMMIFKMTVFPVNMHEEMMRGLERDHGASSGGWQTNILTDMDESSVSKGHFHEMKASPVECGWVDMEVCRKPLPQTA